MNIEAIEDSIIDELQEWDFMGDVIVSDPTWVEVAYSWVYKNKDRTDAIEWLNQRGITSTGRYGKWLFQGMCASIADGLEIEA